MQDTYRPVIFQRHTHQLRAVLIDRQPWLVGLDFGRLIGTCRPYHLPKRMDPEQQRAVVLEYLSGFREEVEVISESTASGTPNTATSPNGSATKSSPPSTTPNTSPTPIPTAPS
jgi:hypothetical protein